MTLKHPRRKLKKQIWTKNSLFLLYEEETSLNYYTYGNDAYIPYDTNILCNIKNECVIDDFDIHSDGIDNKCMLVTKNNLKVIDMDI